MQITVSNEEGEVFNLEVDQGEQVENVKAILEAETGIPMASQRLLYEGKALNGYETLSDRGVSDGDLLLLLKEASAGAPSSSQHPTALSPDGSAMDPIAFLEAVGNNPETLQLVKRSHPQLAQFIAQRNIESVQSELRRIHSERLEAERVKAKQFELLASDPFNIEAQRKIEEAIRQAQVDENLEAALESTPESFATVVMLYVDMEVNGIPVKAFVDSGAQSTIMSQKCAEKCKIMRLCDRRFSGIARGVGTQRIVGRVHQAPLKVAGSYFPCTFTILENDDMEFLFGLDMLRRHECTIDLKRNLLVFGTGQIEVPFLSEGQLPEHLRGGPLGPSKEVQQKDEAPGPAIPPSVAEGSETKVRKLSQLGFSREQALEALRACDGDVDRAASLLFGGF